MTHDVDACTKTVCYDCASHLEGAIVRELAGVDEDTAERLGL